MAAPFGREVVEGKSCAFCHYYNPPPTESWTVLCALSNRLCSLSPFLLQIVQTCNSKLYDPLRPLLLLHLPTSPDTLFLNSLLATLFAADSGIPWRALLIVSGVRAMNWPISLIAL